MSRGAAVTPANENLGADAGRWYGKGGSLHATIEAAYAQKAAVRTDAGYGKAVVLSCTRGCATERWRKTK